MQRSQQLVQLLTSSTHLRLGFSTQGRDDLFKSAGLPTMHRVHFSCGSHASANRLFEHGEDACAQLGALRCSHHSFSSMRTLIEITYL